MLNQPVYAWRGSDAELRDLLAAHPWVTMVSDTPAGLVVSHLPVLPDPDTTEVAIIGHLARADAEEHRVGTCDAVIVVQGPHGYVSPSWYAGGPYVPTWNFVVAHLHGRPEVLDAEASYDVLDRTVAHFESARPDPFRLDQVAEYAAQLAPHVVAFRLRPQRVVAKAKLSQDKPLADIAGVLRGLEDPTDVHADLALAEAMRADGLTD